MTYSPNLNFSLISQNQSQKEITANEALITIDSILNNGVIGIINTLPKKVISGELYIIGENPSELLKNKNGYLAYFYENSWKFTQPKNGCTLWLTQNSTLITFNNNKWNSTLNTVDTINTYKDSVDSICSKQSLAQSLHINTNHIFRIPIKIQINVIDYHNIFKLNIHGLNEENEKISEEITINKSLTISKNWFLNIKSITLENISTTKNMKITLGNTQTLIKISSQNNYIDIFSDTIITLPTEINQEFKLTIINPNAHKVSFAQNISWNNSFNANSIINYIIVSNKKILGIQL